MKKRTVGETIIPTVSQNMATFEISLDKEVDQLRSHLCLKMLFSARSMPRISIWLISDHSPFSQLIYCTQACRVIFQHSFNQHELYY